MYCDARLRLSPWSMLLLIGCYSHSISLTWFKAFIGFFPLYCAILRHSFNTVSRFLCILLGGNVLFWLLFSNNFIFVVMAHGILLTYWYCNALFTLLWYFRCLTCNYYSFIHLGYTCLGCISSYKYWVKPLDCCLIIYFWIIFDLHYYSILSWLCHALWQEIFCLTLWPEGPLCGLRPEVLWGWAAPRPFACKPSCWLVYHNYAFGALPPCLSDLHVP